MLFRSKDIKMPLAITTVDIKTAQKYVFTNVELKQEKNTTYVYDIPIEKAVRASCSYPFVFAPCEYGNCKFVDGGILDNTPAGEVKKLGADKVVTVKFAVDLENDPKNM